MPTKNQYFPQSVPHPGETLAEKLEEMNMGPKEFAIRTGKPEKTITAILKAESGITPDMAVVFETVLNIPAYFWLNNQRIYDEYKAREKRQAVLREAAVWASAFPLADMLKKGWLPATGNSMEEKAGALLHFFGIASHIAWENYYFNQQLKVAFRISLAHSKEPYAVSAWLRKGELQAAELHANPYNEKKFKDALPKLKTLMAQHPDDFFIQLQRVCLSVGVKVVYTPCLPKAPINGATRWLNDDTALIQLSCRYKRNDIFWFTFFHEAGHILLHGKKDIFLESMDYSNLDQQKEAEANAFAVKWILTEEQETEIIQRIGMTDEDIIEFARQFNTHPGVIVGRLQHKGLLHPSLGRNLIVSVKL